MGKLTEQRVGPGAGPRELDVIAVLKKIQDSFAAVTFCADRDVLVVGRALGRVDTESILRLAHVVDVGGDFGRAALEILVEEILKIVEEIYVCTAIDVLIQRIRLVKGRCALRLRMAGERFCQKFGELHLM